MMVESGEVQKLWRDFHITLKAAREVKVGFPYAPSVHGLFLCRNVLTAA